VLDDLELAVLALGDDVLGDELTARDLLGDRLHDGVVRPDRIGRDDVDVGERQRFGDGFATGDQELLVLFGGGRSRRGDNRHCWPPFNRSPRTAGPQPRDVLWLALPVHRLASPSAAARPTFTDSPRLRLRLALPSQTRLAFGCGSPYLRSSCAARSRPGC